MNEVEHDIENYQGQGLLKAEVDNANKEPKKQRTIQMKHAKISCQVNSYNIFFNVLSMQQCPFLKQLNDSNQSFKLMKINISSTTCRFVL